VPAWSFTVGAEYEHELANADSLIGRFSFHHESNVQVVEGLPAFIVKNPVTGAVVPGGFQPGLDAAKPFTREVNELEASLTYAMQNGFEFTLWGRNLTNNRNISTIFDSTAQSGSVSAYTNVPRTWGGSIRYRW
jgi:outer membrane receptor protein involved in Fe transport